MNPQLFECPKCEQPFQVAASQLGKVVQCPACTHSISTSKANNSKNSFPQSGDAPVIVTDRETSRQRKDPLKKPIRLTRRNPDAPTRFETTPGNSKPEKKKRWRADKTADSASIQIDTNSSKAKVSKDEKLVTQEPVNHLLPPRFEVDDPKRVSVRSGSEQFKTFLPDGKGGIVQTDQRVVWIQHDGKPISLVAMTPKQKQRRRMIQNTIAVLMAIAMMAMAFSMLH